MIHIELEDLLHVASRVVDDVQVRDVGLLESALARPRATAFGADAYPTIHEKAAALLQSVAMNHGLIDGNKRLALAATIAFYGLNGRRLTLTNDEAYDMVIGVIDETLDTVGVIAARLEEGTGPRSTGPRRASPPAPARG